MVTYLLKRSLSVLFISFLALIAFFFMRHFLPNAGLPCSFEDMLNSNEAELKACKRNLTFWGLNKPIFYFSITTKSFPKEYFSLLPSYKKEKLREAILAGKEAACLLQKEQQQWNSCPQSSYLKSFCPIFYWHGSENQFHIWLKRLLSLDFGYSFTDNIPVWDKVHRAFGITLLISSLALFFIIVSSLILAIIPFRFSNHNNHWYFPYFLILLANVPSFVIAILLQMTFTSDFISPWLDWFPATGLKGETLAEKISFLILPVFCISFGEICYLTLQVYSSIKDKAKAPFVLYARTKRLTEKQIINKHILPAALVPLTPLIQNFFISLILGSLIIEVIFNIPGMGRLTYEALVSNDLNLVNLMVFLAALFSGIGFLVADMVLYYLDPRIHFER